MVACVIERNNCLVSFSISADSRASETLTILQQELYWNPYRFETID